MCYIYFICYTYITLVTPADIRYRQGLVLYCVAGTDERVGAVGHDRDRDSIVVVEVGVGDVSLPR